MAKTPLESKFQKQFLDDVRELFPGCVILKNDEQYQQGILDWLVLWDEHWAMLEMKRERPTSPSDFEPNQEYFIELLDSMSFAACVYPENAEEILNDLQQAFQPRRSTRVSKR